MSWKNEFAEAINTFEFTTKIPSTGQEVKFKPVDTATLKKLVVYEKSNDYKMIEILFDELLRNTIIEPNDLDLDAMLLFDRQFLLMEIRSKSKGEGIQQPYSCPKCGGQSVQTISLNSMPFKEYVAPVDSFIEVANGVGMHVGHVSRAEQKEMYTYLDGEEEFKGEDKETVSPFYTFGAAIKAYVSKSNAKPELTAEEKVFILDKLPDAVLDKIKKWLEDNAFGYELSFSYLCPHCGNHETRKLEFGDSI